MSSTEEFTEDSSMIKVMYIVIAALIVLALLIFGAARLMGGGDGGASDTLLRNAMLERIAPVGGVRTSADELPAASTAVAVADAGGAVRTGAELVEGVCAACHAAGVGGAPLLGDEEAWAARREAGLDALVASVINGKGSMPARGGSDYSDDEIRRSVQAIALFEESGDAAGDDSAAADTAPEGAAATDQAATDAPADTAADTDAATDEAAASEDDAAAADDTAVADDTAAAEEAPAEDTVAPTTETATAEAAPAAEEAPVAEEAPAADTAVAVAAPAEIVPVAIGVAPENLPDHVKVTVDGVCSGCHLAAVAGAPKTGDVAAWEPRAALGIEALTASVIAGKGAMPARGGSNLSDEDIAIAIQYLMSK